MNKILSILAILILGATMSAFATNHKAFSLHSCPPTKGGEPQRLVAYGGGVGSYDTIAFQNSGKGKSSPRCQAQIMHSWKTLGKLCWAKSCNGAITLKKGSGTCGQTQIEFTITGPTVDYDISLVNGWGGPASITVDGQTISASGKHAKGQGIYPYGYDWCNCASSGSPGCVATNCPKGQSAPGPGCNLTGSLPVKISE